jgi:hypothetical protein
MSFHRPLSLNFNLNLAVSLLVASIHSTWRLLHSTLNVRTQRVEKKGRAWKAASCNTHVALHYFTKEMGEGFVVDGTLLTYVRFTWQQDVTLENITLVFVLFCSLTNKCTIIL